MRAFREKFGRGWDVERMEDGGEEGADGGKGREDNLMDLISGFGQEAEMEGTAKGVRGEKERSGKGKGGER